MAEKEITMWHLQRSLAKTRQLFWRYFVSFQKVSKIWHFTYQWIIGLRPCSLLFSKPKEIGYEATSTKRKNKVERKCQLVPIKEMTKSSKGGDICAAVARNTDRNEEVKLVQLEDNNVVTVCSTVFGTEPIKKVQRWSRIEKKKIDVDRPHIVEPYCKTMGGTDRQDQHVNNYRSRIRGKSGGFYGTPFVYPNLCSVFCIFN